MINEDVVSWGPHCGPLFLVGGSSCLAFPQMLQTIQNQNLTCMMLASVFLPRVQ